VVWITDNSDVPYSVMASIPLHVPVLCPQGHVQQEAIQGTRQVMNYRGEVDAESAVLKLLCPPVQSRRAAVG
jgi:hypothetical protein